LYKERFIFLKNVSNERHEKEQKFVQKIEKSLVRKSFDSREQLKTAVYATLVRYLENNEFIRTTPFDATLNQDATFEDLDEEKIREFAQIAHRKRSFPFDKDSDTRTILSHLNLIKDARITNAAILLFGKRPQRFFITSEVKCAHFHGLRVSKPIPSYQVYKGDVFEMIAASVDFVLSKINLYVGERDKSATVDVRYEIPIQAVTEAIVNAVCHRDYTSNGSVQVMLFADRLEVANPGHLPYGLTIEQLYVTHNSIPNNPLLAEPMYLCGTIERMGTGTEDMAERCIAQGLKKPDYNQSGDFRVVLFRQTPQETPYQIGMLTSNLINILGDNILPAKQIMNLQSLKDYKNFLQTYLQPALKEGYIEMLYPENPKRKGQRYYLTEKGKASIRKK
jgi:predicted HTH transcriptional regulator